VPLLEAGTEILRTYYLARFGGSEAQSPETLRRLRELIQRR
jgi:hypothetical protein